MRKYIVLLVALGGLVGSAVSVETEIDMDFMQNVEDTNKSLASNIAVKDAPSSIGDAKQLEAMFAQVEAFYARKGGAEDAVDLSKKSKELSAEIIKSAGAKDFETATNKATDLSRTCKSCHSFYKKS